MTESIKPTDGRFLHFLKELPAWCVLSILALGFAVMWQFSHDDFIPRIIDGLVGGILASVMGQRPRTLPSTNIQAETVETPAVNTDVMNDTTVNTDNLNFENKENKL